MIDLHLTDWFPQEKKLFGEDDAYGRAIFFGVDFDTDDIAAQAQGAVLCAADSWIIELDLQFRLQLRTVVQVNQRAMKAQVADHGLFFKRHAGMGKTSDRGAEMSVATEAFANGGNHDV